MRLRSMTLGLLLLLSAAQLLAQQNRGTLTGTVTDASGAVIPGVAITIQNVETNATYEAVSNQSGQYRAPNGDRRVEEEQGRGSQGTGARRGGHGNRCAVERELRHHRAARY